VGVQVPLPAPMLRKRTMNFYNEVSFIPVIPQELIEDVESMEKRKNVFPYPNYAHTYASYEASEELSTWIQQYFDKPVLTRYQVIKKKLPVHVDVGISGIKYNYLLSTGGDAVKTRWWNSVDNPTTLLFEVTSKLHVWHSLNIETPHDISEISSPRVSITVREE
jgi:hypothetical protein